jgi:hypothetical protein
MLGFVKHSYAVPHVLEGDTEFLLALPNFAKQPGVLHCDHRLSGEAL